MPTIVKLWSGYCCSKLDTSSGEGRKGLRAKKVELFMVRINCERMRRRRLELGWTPEELAGEASLDARTIRRIEQGGTLTRLRSAVAVAKALELEVTALVLDDRSGGSEPQGDGGGLSAALTAADGTIRREIVSPGEWSPKEALYVLSILLTRSLVVDGKRSEENDEVDRVVAAFKAADGAVAALRGSQAEANDRRVKL